jgi:tight adherence protein B
MRPSAAVLPLLAVLAAAATHAAVHRWWRHRCLRRLPGHRTRPRAPVDLRRLRRVLARRSDPADDVATTLDQIARAVAAGLSLTVAVEQLTPAPAHRPFAALLAPAVVEHRLGLPFADALARTADRLGRDDAAPEPALAMTVLEFAARHGGVPAIALDRAAASVRERRAVVAERAVQSAQARMSALVLTLLPLGFAVWTLSTDQRVRTFLAGSPLGWGIIAAGLASNALGWLWMRRLIRGPR